MLIEFLPQSFTAAKLPHGTPIPEGEFVFFSRTDSENSLICPTENMPTAVTDREDGWCGMRIVGQLDFSLLGILARIAAVLAEAEVGILALSTYDTDYIFVKLENSARAKEALLCAGYEIRADGVEIGFGTPEEICSWMSLVRDVRSNFPGLETEEALAAHRRTVEKFINRRTAIRAKADGRIIGVLLFSPNRNLLCCMAVDPAYRRRHIAQDMFALMRSVADSERELTVSTFRENDPLGIAPRAFYEKMGFRPDELTEECGYPVQKFIRPAEKQ